MISHPNLIVQGNYRIDPQGVLSIKVDSPTGHDEAFQSGSEWFAPYRRLLTADQVATELRNTGFVIQSQRMLEQKDPRKPILMQIRVGRRRWLNWSRMPPHIVPSRQFPSAHR